MASYGYKKESSKCKHEIVELSSLCCFIVIGNYGNTNDIGGMLKAILEY